MKRHIYDRTVGRGFSLQGRRAFDLEQYKSLLKRAKAKKPEKIMEWLEREPDPLRAGS